MLVVQYYGRARHNRLRISSFFVWMEMELLMAGVLLLLLLFVVDELLLM